MARRTRMNKSKVVSVEPMTDVLAMTSHSSQSGTAGKSQEPAIHNLIDTVTVDPGTTVASAESVKEPDRDSEWPQASQSVTSTDTPEAVCPRFCILTSVYDAGEWLAPALNSAAACLMGLEAEWLIINDCSSDNSDLVIRKFLEQTPIANITYISNKSNLGLENLNLLLEISQADYFIIADHDDISLPGRFQKISDTFKSQENCLLFSSNALLIDSQDLPVGVFNPEPHSQTLHPSPEEALVMGSPRWLGATMAFHRSLIASFERIDNTLLPGQIDNLVSFRCALLSGIHYYEAEPLIGWRQHPRNSHRLSGSFSSDTHYVLHAKSLQLMLLSQKARDFAHISSQRVLHDTDFSTHNFFSHFAQASHSWAKSWSQVNQFLLQDQPVTLKESTSISRKSYPIPQLPLLKLNPGETYFLDQTTNLAYYLRNCIGFYKPEAKATWSSAHVLLNLVVPATANFLTVEFYPFMVLPQTIKFFINMLPVETIQINTAAHEPTKLHFNLEGILRQGNILSFYIHVPTAQKPSVALGTPDDRLLGLFLKSIGVN